MTRRALLALLLHRVRKWNEEVLSVGFVRGFKRFSESVDKICLLLVVVMIAAMVGITCAQIICRLFFKALSWSEEATRYLLVWATFLGASCVYRANGHISITALHGLVPHKMKKAVQILIHVLCMVVFVLALYYGIKYAGKQSAQLSASMRLPMSYMYAAVPAGFGLCLLHAVNHIMQLFAGEEEVA